MHYLILESKSYRILSPPKFSKTEHFLGRLLVNDSVRGHLIRTLGNKDLEHDLMFAYDLNHKKLIYSKTHIRLATISSSTNVGN